MKDFQDVSVKRQVQNFLFSKVNIKNTVVTGLAGKNPLEYKKLIEHYFDPLKVELVDFYRYPDITQWNYISKVQVTPVMDCDFCSSVVNSGEEFLTVFDNLKKLPAKEKVLAFTFSTRMAGGLDETLKWLSHYLYNDSFKEIDRFVGNIYTSKYRSYILQIQHEQSVFKKSLLVRYRETSNMLSGIVSW